MLVFSILTTIFTGNWKKTKIDKIFLNDMIYEASRFCLFSIDQLQNFVNYCFQDVAPHGVVYPGP